ncbi:hypothetical protein ACOSP7_002499 [Xanthoceras sorbifolium]
MLKLNVDASVQASAGIFGVGAIVRNEVGEVMLTAASKLAMTTSVACAEAHAILFGISIALEAGLWPLEVESDCVNVVNLIVQQLIPLNELGVILEDIIRVSGQGGVSCFRFVPRLANRGAHALAQFGCSLSDLFVCLEDYPSFISDVILDDTRNSLFH